MIRISFPLLASVTLLLLQPVNGTADQTFYVASSGSDSNTGLSPQAPWSSLDKVNQAELKPGDKVLFKRGETWRGQLVPQNGRDGAPVYYGAYGEGAMPRLLGSISRNRPEDWRHEDGNIWCTGKPVFTELESRDNLAPLKWTVHA